MTDTPRRGVTRGYVGGLIFAIVVCSVAVVVASWGVLSLAVGRQPVETPDVPAGVAPVLLLGALVLLAWGLWRQSLQLLRGHRELPWASLIGLGVGAYLVWSLGGIAFGFLITDTWLSPFAGLLVPIWAIAAVLCWAVLARRVYTDKPTPQWPWERRGEPGPDWSADEDPWGGAGRE